MKNLVFWTILALFCTSCEKEKFDINNPDVESFVNQLKNGTYNYFEKGENGENLWLLMPKFSESHIQALILFSKDTSHITNYPVNPISSRRPYPQGREYFILGECLLWTIEGIRKGNEYGSLDPFLIDLTKTQDQRMNGIKASEILIVRELYKNWWDTFKGKNWKEIYPLEETPYRWF